MTRAGARNIPVAAAEKKRPPEALKNGLPRQCEHWLAMTGQGQRAGAIGGDADGQAVPFGFFSATMTPLRGAGR